MENTEAIWQQRLAKRREGTPWKVIIEAEGFKYGGTFTGHLKIARDTGLDSIGGDLTASHSERWQAARITQTHTEDHDDR